MEFIGGVSWTLIWTIEVGKENLFIQFCLTFTSSALSRYIKMMAPKPGLISNIILAYLFFQDHLPNLLIEYGMQNSKKQIFYSDVRFSNFKWITIVIISL